MLETIVLIFFFILFFIVPLAFISIVILCMKYDMANVLTWDDENI